MSATTDAGGAPAMPRALRRALGVIVALLFVYIGWRQIDGIWMQRVNTVVGFDDEGYVMISLRSFVRGAPLYDDTYSQYGPAFFLLLGLPLRWLGIELTHDWSRAITAVEVLLIVGFFAATAWRLTGSWLAALLSIVLARAMVWHFYVEPLHPHGLCWVFTAGLVFLASRSLERITKRDVVLIGLLLAALTLTKVNIGVLVALGLLAGWLGGRASASRASWRWWAAWVALASVPVLVLRGEFQRPLMTTYVTFVLGAVASRAIAAGASTRDEHAAPRVLRWLALSTALGGALGLLAILACGTSFEGLLWGVVGQHAQFLAGADPPPIGLDCRANSVISVLLACGWWFARRHRPESSAVVGTALALAWGLVCATMLCARDTLGLMNWGLPFAWVVLACPRRSFGGAEPAHEAWVLSGVAAFQGLQAFPVPGTQCVWTVLLLVPLCAVALHRSASTICAALATRLRWPRVATCVWIAFGAFGAQRALVEDGLQKAAVEVERRSTVPLGLPGAEHVRATESVAAGWRWISDTARASGRFFSSPSQNSIYFWSRTDPPTDLNYTFRPDLLRPSERQRVAAALAAEPRLFVAFLSEFESYLMDYEPNPDDPVATLLKRELVPFGHWSNLGAWSVRGWSPGFVSCARIEDDWIVLRTGCPLTREVAAVEVVSLASDLVVGRTDVTGENSMGLADEQGRALTLPSAAIFAAPTIVKLGPTSARQHDNALARKLVGVRLLDRNGERITTFPLVVR